MAKKRLPIASVKVGMYLCGIDRSWMDTPFLRHRFLIRSPSDLTELRQCGIKEITIDTDRGLDDTSATETQPQEETAVTTPPDPPRVTTRRPFPPKLNEYGTFLKTYKGNP